MNAFEFQFHGAALSALPSGALWWAEKRLLTVSDLHLGKSERAARRLGMLLPPYEIEDTLARLDADIASLGPQTVLCLGDSFDDSRAAEMLDERHVLWLSRLMAGRRWIWIEGNHDPGPLGLGGSHLAMHLEAGIGFRHIADAGAVAEISGHYHPKARIGGRARPCFLADRDRIVMPAYGTYTGGLNCTDPALSGLMKPDAMALLLGPRITAVPMPRPAA
jgi:DNA ligase-associated metallophosphoesterase